MTAIDAAIQARLLGAEEVTICYRRGKQHMNASEWEQDLAASKGVTIRHWLRPLRVLTEGGRVTGIELEYTALEDGQIGRAHSELQSLMRISYAVFCLKKKKTAHITQLHKRS